MYSIDSNAIFMQGSSNGSEFVHFFASQRPDVPRAVAPVYGLPLIGRMKVPQELGKVPINLSYDRSDTTIPYEGGVSAYNMIYESKKTVLAAWARNHHCESTSVDLVGVNTPFDGGEKNVYCQEYKNCQDGRVMTCMYDGIHGDWPYQIDQINWWFFSQYLPR